MLQDYERHEPSVLLEDSVKETIDRQQLIPVNATVLVAISGGPDSVALLHSLKQLGYSIEGAHLNHQFRGEESDEDARFVASLCAALSIPLYTESIDVQKVKAEQHISAQQAARLVRYDFLNRVLAERKLGFIATAHNRDDRVETVLLNILRGTGTDGLKGIPFRRGKIIRPLLDSPRSAVDDYLRRHNLASRVDSSNSLPKYVRNSVRAELLPHLEKRYNPSIRATILRLSEIASDESNFLNDIAASWVNGRTQLPVAELLAVPVALQRRILREWVKINVDSELADVSHTLIEELRKGLGEKKSVTFPGGKFVAESDSINASIRRLDENSPVALEELPLKINQESLFGDYLVTLIAVGPDVDERTIFAKQWTDGDRITLRAGTRKVQDIFTDRKVPRDTRRRYPIIADQNGLISVGDISYALRAAGTKVRVVKAD